MGLKRRREEDEYGEEKDKNRLAKKYPHAKDSSILFDEEPHIYSVDWDEDPKEEGKGKRVFSSDGIISVTSFIHRDFEHFDADKVIAKMQASKKWPKSKYFGLTPDEIKALWDANSLQACTAGSVMHLQIEWMYNGSPPEEPCSIEYKQFLEYHHKIISLKWLPFRTEWMLRSPEKYLLTGTIDMLYLPPEGPERTSVAPDGRRILHLHMADWKRSLKITLVNPWSTGKDLCSDLPDTNFYHYSLQLNTYKYMLENWYHNMLVDGIVYDDIQIDSMAIVAMHPETRTEYLELAIDDYQPLIARMFERRAKEIIKNF